MKIHLKRSLICMLCLTSIFTTSGIEAREKKERWSSSSHDQSCSNDCKNIEKGIKCLEHQFCKIRKDLAELERKLDCGKDIKPIFAKDLPITITESGVYCLAEDTIFNPPNLGYNNPTVQAGITIEASNVVLHLGSHHYSQFVPNNPSAQSPYVVGISVSDVLPTSTDPNAVGLQSVYILGDNAVIEDFSMIGVRIFGHTSDIRIQGVSINNNGALASKALRADSRYYPHDIFIPGTNDFIVGGLIIGESRSFGMGPEFFNIKASPQNRIKNVIIDNVSCLNNFFNGLTLVNTTNITINNSHFDFTWSDDPGTQNVNAFLSPTGAFFGLDADYSLGGSNGNINANISNSTFNNTSLIGDLTTRIVPTLLPFTAQGVHDVDTTNFYYSNCQINNTSATFLGGLSVLGYGSARNRDSVFVNCTFNGTRSPVQVQAFHRSGDSPTGTLSSKNTVLINCTANNNQQIGNLATPQTVATGFFQVVGFGLFYLKNVTMIDCTAENNILNGPAIADCSCIGFLIDDSHNFPPAPGPRESIVENIVLRGCFSSRNLTMMGGRAIGFAVTSNLWNTNPGSLLSVSLENCTASGMLTLPTAFPGSTQGVANGFFIWEDPASVANTSWPVSITGCKAFLNQGPSSVATTMPGISNGTVYSTGFYLINAKRCTVTGCESTNNIYGVLLQQCDRCTIRNCQSDNNTNNAMAPTGEGFTDVGQTGTTSAPSQSTSIWESNRAFANGLNTPASHVGPNGNYNIWMNPALTLRPPLLRGQASTGAYTFTDPNVTYFSNLHNNSVVS